MQVKADQLAGNLKRGLAPVYLVGGEEPLLLLECCDQIRAAARAAGFVERELLHADANFDWPELQQVAAPSLFASRKIIDLRLRTGKPGQEGARVLSDWADSPDPDVLLLISCEQWDKSSRSSKWAAKLGAAGVRVDVWPVNAQELPRWLEQRMRQHGMQPEPDVLRVLADRLEGNLLAARQEIDRLALIKGAGRVTLDDVMRVVADSSRFDGFTLAEHMLSGNLREGLRVAAGLKRMDTPLPMLLGALLKELRTVEAYGLAMRGGENENMVFRRLNVWQNRQQTVRTACRRLRDEHICAAFQTLSLIDRQSKGQASGDPWQTIDTLLLQLAA